MQTTQLCENPNVTYGQQQGDDSFSDVSSDWLKLIYENRLQRFLHDNDRIWSSGALLLPLSLAPFLVLPSIRHPRVGHFAILGLASSILILAWLVIAESHRRYQTRSFETLKAIERHVGLHLPAAAGAPDLRGIPRLTRPLGARWARRSIALSVPVLWIVAAIVWPR